MTLLFGEMCWWKNIGYGGNVHGVVGQKGLSTSDKAAQNGVGDAVAFLVEFFVLGVHIAIHCDMKSKYFVRFGVGSQMNNT